MQKYFEINAPGHNVRCKLYFEDQKALASADKAVIFGIGFAGHKDNNAARVFAEKLISKHRDTVVIVFNWPAHGDDVKKRVSLEDCMTYLELVVKDTETQFGIRERYAYATSFGGYLVLKYISERGNPFRKIALRCPAVDMYDVFTRSILQGDEYARIEKGKDALVGFDRKIAVNRDFLEALRKSGVRERDFLEFAEDILILHGTADEVVPFESSRTFADDQLMEFVPVEGADHRFQNPVHMSLANKAAMQWFGLG